MMVPMSQGLRGLVLPSTGSANTRVAAVAKEARAENAKLRMVVADVGTNEDGDG
jgi:hypothetical protein